ncbi:tyrosine-type recombinase/integrase [Romboutsia sedimentorum]|uniref:tyrosine-type recombinase/integrase n=1 Tax=Romboutsia sedimentorum TaxID=1368474 RepID=UPI0024DE8E1A|nr:tyrosine-type recombinase/integrase [Romboutsia sedimentorum]MDK2584238.1 tyrosine-type recombinase/integrase [Romboutsia sedimentorum]
MSVRKRGDKWAWCINLANIDGKRQRKEKGGYATRKEAQLGLIKAQEEYENCGKITIESNMSMSDYMDYFYENYSKVNLKYYTYYCVHRNSIENHIKPSMGHYRLKSITPAILQSFFDEMYKKGYAKESLKKVFGVLGKSFKLAVYPYEYLKQNPMEHVSLRDYRYDKKEDIRVVDKCIFQKVADYYKQEEHYFYIPIIIAFNTGMRRGEVLALRWEDINFDDKSISIKHSITFKEHGKWELNSPKTHSSIRKIAIGDTLLDILKKHKDRMNLLHPNANFVCIKPSTGKLITIYDLKNVNKKTREIFDIGFNMHDLRHTHATMLLEGGVSLKLVSGRLGHANIYITADIYMHVTKKLERDSVNIFESML